MNVAFNTCILRQPRTGIAEYTLQLGMALRSESGISLSLFDGWNWRHDFHAPSSTTTTSNNIIALARKHLPGAYTMRRLLWQRRFRHGLKKIKPAAYHEPSLWPLDFDGPTLMTLHDLTHIHYPDTQPQKRLQEIERRLPRALEKSSIIFTDSEFVANEARQYYGITADKIRVATLGCSARFHPRSAIALQPILRRWGLQMRRYFLCLGTLEPRKNTLLAITAYLKLPQSMQRAFPLLLIGGGGWGNASWQRSLAQAMAHEHIYPLGYQDDATVAALLAGACALVFPSRYEGFGLPVLEAMASATPVITSRRGAIPEVAGETVCYVDPDDVQACSQALQTLAEDSALQQHLSAQGLERSRQFSWSRCAHITATAYRQAGNI